MPQGGVLLCSGVGDSEIETLVAEMQTPVFLTKNGYGSMVVMSIDMYDRLTNNIEAKLDEADSQAKSDPTRYTHEEVFSSIREQSGML